MVNQWWNIQGEHIPAEWELLLGGLVGCSPGSSADLGIARALVNGYVAEAIGAKPSTAAVRPLAIRVANPNFFILMPFSICVVVPFEAVALGRFSSVRFVAPLTDLTHQTQW